MSFNSARFFILSIAPLLFFVGCQLRDSEPNTLDQARQTEVVSLQQGYLTIDGVAFDIKGICWNPIPKGQTHPEGLAFLIDSPAYDLDFIERDLKLIADAGFNTLRPYRAITDPKTLDLIESYGLKVIVPIFNYYAISDEQVRASVLALKDNPTTLFWEIGNEWNYNNLYNPEWNFEQSLSRIQEVISLARSIDEKIPIAINYGEVPTKEVEQRLDVDLWGLNIYQSDDFGYAFEQWKETSDKPMYIGEYGADAIDNRNGDGRYAEKDQAYAVAKLTEQIVSQYASTGGGVTLGGALFELSDEWWKDSTGLPTEHDIGGIAPGGGPYPDLEFNEEWWGIVDIDRNPRPAYHSIKAIYTRQ